MDGAWAGLALVFTGEPHDIAEFFVMRKYRRHGVGTHAATRIFEQYPGRWTVREQVVNRAAAAFWRRAIPCTFDEVEEAGEIVQSFTVGQ